MVIGPFRLYVVKVRGAQDSLVQSLNLLVEGRGEGRQLGDQRLLRVAAHSRGKLLLDSGGIAEILDIGQDSRQDLLLRHLQHGQGFNVKGLAVIFHHNLIPRLDLRRCKDFVFRKQRNIFLTDEVGQRIHCGFEI